MAFEIGMRVQFIKDDPGGAENGAAGEWGLIEDVGILQHSWIVRLTRGNGFKSVLVRNWQICPEVKLDVFGIIIQSQENKTHFVQCMNEQDVERNIRVHERAGYRVLATKKLSVSYSEAALAANPFDEPEEEDDVEPEEEYFPEGDEEEQL